MLIRSKLKAPSLRSRMLFRKDLINRLHATQGHSFIIFSGPGGSGKSSLACQWVKKEGFKNAWYSIDQEDDDPDLFFRYLLAAFIRQDDRLKESFGPMVDNRYPLSGKLVVSLIIESLTDEDRKVRLFLDDFHHIKNDKILKNLARLMQYIPESLQLIILSRHSLPPALGSVALKNEHLMISPTDLKFSETETAELFKKFCPISISNDKIRMLNQHVEGWAAGLQLISLNLKSKGDDFDFSSILNQAHAQIAGYLIHDILSRQPEKIRNFIFTTALLDRFNPKLCAKITKQKDAAKILAHIEHTNLFLIVLDARGKWYRYHHMFSEVIRQQMALDNPTQLRATLHKAAKWFAENNYIEDAMRCAFKSDDLEFAADLLEDNIFQYIEQLNPTAGLRWVLRFPSEILNQRIFLRLQQGTLLLILLELAKLREILAIIEKSKSRALAGLPDDKRILCENYIIFYRFMLNIFEADDLENNLQLTAIEKEISPQNNYLLTGIKMNIVFNYILKGDLAMAQASLKELTNLTATLELIPKKLYLNNARAYIARYQGWLQKAETIIVHVQKSLDNQKLNCTPMAFILLRHLGYIYYLQNRLAEAQKCADLTARYCEHSGLNDEVMTGTELQLRLLLAAEKKEQAAECIKQLREYAIKFDIPKFTAGVDACAAQMAIEQDNISLARFWSQKRNLQPNEPFSMLFAMECIIQARLYYIEKKYSKAVELLEAIRNRCVKRNLLELVLYIDILRSAAFNALKWHDTANSTLVEALAFSEMEGYVRPFVDDARHIAPILKDIAQNMAPASLSSHLKKVFSDCNIPLRQTASLNDGNIIKFENLTKREIEILSWMAQGALNKEIAQKASISIHTVKTHVHRILSKLDVQTRTQAIIKAREMEILRNS